MCEKYKYKLEEEKNKDKYKSIFNTIEKRYDKVDGIRTMYRDGRYIRITLRNWEHIIYEMNIKTNIEEMEGVYEEISTMIRNGLYPIDK